MAVSDLDVPVQTPGSGAAAGADLIKVTAKTKELITATNLKADASTIASTDESTITLTSGGIVTIIPQGIYAAIKSLIQADLTSGGLTTPNAAPSQPNVPTINTGWDVPDFTASSTATNAKRVYGNKPISKAYTGILVKAKVAGYSSDQGVSVSSANIGLMNTAVAPTGSGSNDTFGMPYEMRVDKSGQVFCFLGSVNNLVFRYSDDLVAANGDWYQIENNGSAIVYRYYRADGTLVMPNYAGNGDYPQPLPAGVTYPTVAAKTIGTRLTELTLPA